ncbi:MAG: glutathione S-transferase family protein [Pseudomonadota bacterium]
MKVFGVSVSYYTGKLEAYLRYKGLSYEMESPFGRAKEILPHTGAIQVPMVLLEDGRWMSDSTPIIAYLDQQHQKSPVMPDDPVVRFVALLIEDYADEWLWRPAMHYRWSYEHDRALLSRILVDELAQHLKAPRWLKLRVIRNRQRNGFVRDDGVTQATWDHVEGSFRAALSSMSRMLKVRPFLLGGKPSIADFGFMGPMLRHFGQDPTPAEIMRNEAPDVYAWVARVWNTVGDETVDFLSVVPPDAQALLKEISETHLVQLKHNAAAYMSQADNFQMSVQGCLYQNLPVSRYRVYCLERLREEFSVLTSPQQQTVRALLAHPDASVLWDPGVEARSGYDESRQAPFNKAINVYGTGVPGS